MPKYYSYVKKGYLTKEGTTQIYVRYNYDRVKRTLISTGHQIKPEFWDEKKAWVRKSCPHYEEISNTLTDITAKLGHILTYAKENKPYR